MAVQWIDQVLIFFRNHLESKKPVNAIIYRLFAFVRTINVGMTGFEHLY